MSKTKGYVGLGKDLEQGEGITPIARIILDARLFGLIAITENCTNWDAGRIQDLYDRVNTSWEPHGGLPSLMPEELQLAHTKIYDEAISAARAGGWSPDQDLENEN